MTEQEFEQALKDLDIAFDEGDITQKGWAKEYQMLCDSFEEQS